jgi:hypothetical protein
MSRFNTLYHGSTKDVAEILENGANLSPMEVNTVLCNIMRKLIAIEAQVSTMDIIQRTRLYVVTARAVVEEWDLHDLDDGVAGNYRFTATGEGDALDQFHSTVPVKVLEDFEFEAAPIQTMATAQAICPDCKTGFFRDAIGTVCEACHRGIIQEET